MKSISLITTLLFFTPICNAQIVSIPDSIFKNYLLEVAGLDINGDNEIQVEEAEQPNIFQLNVKNLGIADLTGIEAFSNLKIFDCSENPIANVDFSNNIELGILTISNCPISEIDLSNLSELESFVAQHCSLQVLDVSNNLELSVLTLNSNQISNLDVSNNPNLRILRVGDNNLSAINLSNNDQLESIDLSRNNLSELDLSNQDLVEELIVHTNQLTDLNLLHMKDLVNLSCQDNALELMNIENSDSLIILNASRNNLTDLELGDKPNLIRVSFADNLISDIDVRSSIDLERLKFENNFIKEIDVSNNANLTLFESINNLYKVVDVSSNSQLTSFSASGPNLRYIDLANGSNENISLMQTEGELLDCIKVDEDFDINNTPITWNKPATTNYTYECCLNSESAEIITLCEGESYTSPSGIIIVEPGNFQDTLQNCYGCDSLINLEVILTEINTELTTTDSSLMTLNNGGTYQWIDCNTNEIIAGAVDTIYTPLTSGSYAVEVNNLGCIDTSDCVIIDILSSTHNFTEGSPLEIYPNPTDGRISLKMEGKFQALEIHILDYSGRLISNEFLDYQSEYSIEIPSNSGLYFIRVITEDGRNYTHRVFKSRH